MKRSTLSLVIAAALGLGGTALADPVASTVQIDPDGGGSDGTLQVKTLDWSVGNALATPFRVESGSVTNPEVNDIFQIYAHARLGNFIDPGNNELGSGAPNYEWTFVAGFLEQVTELTGSGAGASLSSNTVSGGDNFFEIWYDAPRDANMLAGTGFNDGTRVLWGTVDSGGTSVFERNFQGTGLNSPGGLGNNLDQSGDDDNYPDIDSINGGGNLAISVTVDGYLASFFKDTDITKLLLAFTTEQRLAFNQTDPSASFWTYEGVGGGQGYIDGATVASIGTCNGCIPAFDGDGVDSGPNEIFQSDASNSFLVERIPEPGTIALLGLGLAGLGFSSRRRKLV
jgi:hypothetical protein